MRGGGWRGEGKREEEEGKGEEGGEEKLLRGDWKTSRGGGWGRAGKDRGYKREREWRMVLKAGGGTGRGVLVGLPGNANFASAIKNRGKDTIQVFITVILIERLIVNGLQ